MTLAFYAPMKPPDHPVPSGDRSMARALIRALESAGHTVILASRLRSRDGKGDATRQQQITAEADATLPALIARGRAEGWRAWITYHTYYKAPDLIGGPVAQALGIPYVLVEATRASKRLSGPWAQYAMAAERACDLADAIFYLTVRDAEALRKDAPPTQKLIHLAPFLTDDTLPAAPIAPDGPMLSVGMMRHGDKLASYRIIAETLALLPNDAWRLEIAGDGPARDEVMALMAPFGEKVTFLGNLNAADLAAAYARAALLFWPGVNEAFGFVYLEAQAAGLPVVAQDRPGVREVLARGDYPSTEDGPVALTANLSRLLDNPETRHIAGRAAQKHVADNHLLPAAVATLTRGLASVGVT
ncbi:D-inositol 3-phosphate glycosyltransferase (plasmid) [Sulfitobacter sp. DSM 110093]|uniref:glycosyltransferase family 4 protein n=1 Tax=Sulfitobacter sp. DSM 110093 TaxID=2883127 RepID=UPI001FAC2ABB|nr:glycosyltransferase family 4 protein [Sulfitobacter sp. DSM 110093]UOA34309.1 D-inositol 3-phosphate glycosyltransferase [Sulfitobacter sp. DSM 110093]